MGGGQNGRNQASSRSSRRTICCQLTATNPLRTHNYSLHVDIILPHATRLVITDVYQIVQLPTASTLSLMLGFLRFPPAAPRSFQLQCRLHRLRRCAKRTLRAVSTTASSTAINAPQGELHAALERLKTEAANHVNLSRLQLALRSLESTDNAPVIRVAVLGLENQNSARRLVRLVLADALEEEASWEKELVHDARGERRGILIKYGEQPGIAPSNALVSTLHVPAHALRKNNVEILVSTLNIGASWQGTRDDYSVLRQAAMVPTAETPKSFSGSVSYVTFPVHKSLVIADGLDGFLRMASMAPASEDTASQEHSTLRTAVVPESEMWPSGPGWDRISILNLTDAEQGLQKFRQSTNNSTIYEESWTRSGIQNFLEFLVGAASGPKAATFQPAIRCLVQEVLDDTSKSINKAFASVPTEKDVTFEMKAQQQALIASLSKWATISHTELRDWLDEAFEGRNWAKLRWWKLVWRVDDVSMIANEVIERRWLVDAEKNLIWLAGHIDEAGFYEGQDQLNGPKTTSQSTGAADTDTIATEGVYPPQELRIPTPWPSQIPSARQVLATSTIPALQALAQKLVFETVSVASVSTALSAFMYFSISTTSIYEAGAVAALGTIWALRRLQKRWETAKEYWQSELREAGRQVLRETEDSTRAALLREDRGEPEIEGASDRAAALDALEQARAAFQKVTGDQKG